MVCQDDYVDLVNVPVIIFNAFPVDDVTAFIIFEEARVNRIPYGEYAQQKVSLQANDNYLFEYRKRVSEGSCIIIFSRFFHDLYFFRGCVGLHELWVYWQHRGQKY